MKVLIVGAGIAGPTLAYWLLRGGHEPTLVERAPGLRQGGYLLVARLGFQFSAALNPGSPCMLRPLAAAGLLGDLPVCRRASAARDRRAAGGAEHVDQLPGGGGVLWLLVVAPPAGETGEPHGQARLGL